MYRSMQRMVFWSLLIAAGAIALVTAMGDHKSDYGSLTLPPGGTVELPEGTVKVFYEEGGEAVAGARLSAPLRFQVVPAGGGPPLTEQATNTQATGAQTQRSEDVISRGSVAKLDVPAEGDYVVTGSTGAASPGEISFGTDPFTAVLRKWRLLGALLAGALIVTLLPLPRPRRSADTAWA
jgi:hypothetical protein